MPSNNPSGVTTIHSPPSSSEISVSRCSPVFVSQRKVLPSSLAEASRRAVRTEIHRFDVRPCDR